MDSLAEPCGHDSVVGGNRDDILKGEDNSDLIADVSATIPPAVVLVKTNFMAY